MTKLNYINRRSEGVKLGPIIAKDLRKKVRTTGIKIEAVREGHGLELNVQGKKLTDEGLSSAVEGLEEALSVSSTRLQILNLADNSLTVASLGRLASSLLLASNDLEDLDLSRNNIAVLTDDDVEQWEMFLDSLRQCHMLQKLNLANNNLSGSKPFEIFTRTYLRHFEANEDKWERNIAVGCSFISVADVAEQHLEDAVRTLSLEDRRSGIVCSKESAANSTNTKRVSGLPMIRTINFENVSMDDQGALFLSYVTPRHRWVKNELEIAMIPRGESSLIPNSVESGIIYSRNQQLGSIGLRILELADTLMYDPFDQRPAWQENLSPVEVERLRKQSAVNLNHHKLSSSESSSSEHPKKLSVLPETSREELETLRRKVQRGIIEANGVLSVELWRVTLRFLKWSRLLMIEAPGEHSEEHTPVETKSEGSFNEVEDIIQRQNMCPKATYCSPSEWPELGAASTSASSKPITPNVSPHPRRSFHNVSYENSPASSARTHSTATTKSFCGADDKVSQNETMLCGLTRDIWCKILDNLARSIPKTQPIIARAQNGTSLSRFSYYPAHTILSESQQNAIVNWGRDKKSLITEGELLGKPRSVQIWRVLERLGCLSYCEA